MAGINLPELNIVFVLIQLSFFNGYRGLAKIYSVFKGATLVQVLDSKFRFNSYSQIIKSDFSCLLVSHISIFVSLCKAVVNSMLVYVITTGASLGVQPRCDA